MIKFRVSSYILINTYFATSRLQYNFTNWLIYIVDMYIWHDLPHVWIHCEESGFKQNIWNTYFINIGAPMNYHWPYFWSTEISGLQTLQKYTRVGYSKSKGEGGRF